MSSCGEGKGANTSLRPLALPLAFSSHALVPLLRLGLCPIVFAAAVAPVSLTIPVCLAPVVAPIAAGRAGAAAGASVPGARAVPPVVPLPISVPAGIAAAVVSPAAVVAVPGPVAIAPSIVVGVVRSVASASGLPVSSVGHGSVATRLLWLEYAREEDRLCQIQ